MVQNIYGFIISFIIPLVLAASSSKSSSKSIAYISSSSIASIAASKQDDKTSPSEDSLSPFPTINAVSDEGFVYYTNITLGTPAQQFKLRIDVANSFVWVRSRESLPKCSENQTSAYNDQCESGTGAFSYNESSTFHDFDEWQRLVTLDYIWINGTAAEDTITMIDITGGSKLKSNNITIENFDFVVANTSKIVMGGLGLAGVVSSQLENYNNRNFLDVLKGNEIINCSSYSLYHRDNTTADLVLGGVNQDYYTGEFVYFNQIPYLDSATNQLEYNYPILPLTSLKVSNSHGQTAYITTENDTEPILIDTRSSYNYLPYSMVVALAVQLNAFYSNDNDVWLLKCSVGDLNGTVGFQFGNVTIDVPISDIITPAERSSSNGTFVFDDGAEACLLLVTPNYYFGYSVLGSPFFKSTYIVVDHESNQIAIAQAATAGSESTTTISNSSTIDYAKSAISSGYIPFAVTNNITGSYTMKFDQISIHSSVQPDLVSVSITNGEIFTGRAQQTNSSTALSSTSSGSGKNLLSYHSANGIWGYVMSLLTIIGLGLLL